MFSTLHAVKSASISIQNDAVPAIKTTLSCHLFYFLYLHKKKFTKLKPTKRVVFEKTTYRLFVRNMQCQFTKQGLHITVLIINQD
jgi:hypothetical protein